MASLLIGIAVSAFLSTTSLLVVLTRVSPLMNPGQALPVFFASAFLTVSSIAALVLFGLWRILPIHAWDAGKLLGMSVRQGIFLGIATVILILFHLLSILNWWIAVMIYGVFVLVEVAMNV